ncbi:MAG: hypothetical protein A3C81_02015 [Candidatus Yanofskybacteria bacterium RIFCSPHIGHO2_02_FULL_46_19]|uniref:phenylalanine--tRNA ligase n=2 Tax=Candidatus Yanofskyibacteriota TaxID=1752733 RepID=A0A1F8H5P1_9BACT|nr:MAG: hypothetical protein A3C81_02015 [Candidatus Yanofskybacteria bacterium RIFCSPHIGHO2_02_FULL_46_19]OGN32286.1 MAG: hypothetical protein A3J01_02380 [Candidatus Yanofskybacteria bacterium RIFCSPLOWO2_02_FULL_45_18]
MSLLPQQKGENIIIPREEEQKLRQSLEQKNDADSQRLKRYLEMPDLSRAPDSPIYEVVQKIIGLDYFKGFDAIDVPDIVRADLSFDLFNFPKDHPARFRTDTYFINDEYILRTHTTVMWYYYLRHLIIKERVEKNMPFGVFCHGKVYRKDEIDRHHMNIFHQMDGLYFAPRSQKEITQDDLKEALGEVARGIYGPQTKFRFNPDDFPYTHTSLEMEIQVGSNWLEVLGGGLVQPVVMEKLDMDPAKYTGWAFGFGLERLAIISMDLPDIRLLWSENPRVKKQLKLGQKFVEVSKYPPITRDISFVVSKNFVPNNYFDLIRDIGGNIVEEVKLLDKYENPEKFGTDKISYTYRIVYRSTDRTLTTDEIDPIQKKIYDQTASLFGAELR